jgi:formylglycine-generating enzyme required for sulfatase activity
LVFFDFFHFRECAKDCPEMVVVPGGEFMMGSPPTEEGRYENEGPQHKVTIARPFAVSKFEVTFADWDACVWVGGCPQEGRASDAGMGMPKANDGLAASPPGTGCGLILPGRSDNPTPSKTLASWVLDSQNGSGGR